MKGKDNTTLNEFNDLSTHVWVYQISHQIYKVTRAYKVGKCSPEDASYCDVKMTLLLRYVPARRRRSRDVITRSNLSQFYIPQCSDSSRTWITHNTYIIPRANRWAVWGVCCEEIGDKQRVLMHRHQGWNVRHGLCHIYMRYLYIYELFIAFVCFVVCSLL